MEITSSGVSVYEVVLDLKQWEGLLTNQVPGFREALITFMPSTAEHKCLSGQAGGFHAELAKGTNFGHVVEHVLLELIRLSDTKDTEYSGWTKALGDGRYVIHYGAPGFLTGRLAAILAVEIVSKLQLGEVPDLLHYLELMRNPLEYFARERSRASTALAAGRIDLMENQDAENQSIGREPAPTLSDWQRDNLVCILTAIEDKFPLVSQRWESAFIAFGGDFAQGILDKMELINPNQFISCFAKGDFDTCFQGVANLSRMMKSLGIPLNFVTHSAWLYKNFMQLAILEQFVADKEAQVANIWDFDDFYQNLFHSIMEGYHGIHEILGGGGELALCGFRARQARRGTVLVVDDDVLARKAARNILGHRGIHAIDARDGIEALNILAERGMGIGVVLLDLVMPGLSGQVVCRRIREGFPHVRVILTSGYPLEPELDHCLDEHEVSFLQKPYRSVDLVEAVCDLMDLFVTGSEDPEPAARPWP